jgi:hypothetical protein
MCEKSAPRPLSVKWSIQYEESDDHWLEVRDEPGWRSAIIRCDETADHDLVVEYYRHVAIPIDQRRGTYTRQVTDASYQAVIIDGEGMEHHNYDEYFPIQSLDEEISWMLALREVALSWFRNAGGEEEE